MASIVFFLLAGCGNEIGIDPPNDFPKYITTGKLSTPGKYLISLFSRDKVYLTQFNEKGNLIWYKEGDVSEHMRWSDYHSAEKEGVYYYLENSIVGNSNKNGSTVTKLIVFDENNMEEYFYNYKGKELPIDCHEALVFDFDHYIIASTLDTYDGRDYCDTVIQEVKDGEILWEFSSELYPRLKDEVFTKDDNSISNQNIKNDYMHVNSFAIDPSDNNLLVSFRNQCSIIKINRKTGEPMWKLGGNNSDFKIQKKAEFHYQHSISVVDGKLLLIDNGYVHQCSRVLELKINEEKREALFVKEIELPYYIVSFGEVIKLDNGNYLVQRGQSYSLDIPNGFEEIDGETGKLVFSMDFSNGFTNWIDFIPEK